ncbi:unnamed protein product [Phaedon cochleariae]|uniref:Protein Dr1 n=1 Tax=Phaedon cochleariae TaxID=80249 RepID=A0A9N9SFC9_PHACE|nr:unnamed protein product [Phaedon cochleariae]
MANPNTAGPLGGTNTEDDELTLPRASINKMIKELVPSVRIANEARELILNCCTEFIHLLSSEANEICNQLHKKTINAEHVLLALNRLGFCDYTAEAEAVLKDCKAVAAKRRRQSTRLENLGIPEEELLRQQQELFAKARQEQAFADQQQWEQLQAAAQQAQMSTQIVAIFLQHSEAASIREKLTSLPLKLRYIQCAQSMVVFILENEELTFFFRI